ncbi:MAG: hypothetical protein AAGK22_04730 [Acidobacteriota bacterium]
MRFSFLSVPLLGLLGVLCLPGASTAQDSRARYQRIVNQSSQQPNGQPFNLVGDVVGSVLSSFDVQQGRVAFLQWDTNATVPPGVRVQSAIYVAEPDGTFRQIVDRLTPLPGGGGTFTSFWSPRFFEDGVAFASGSIYVVRSSGTIDAVVDEATFGASEFLAVGDDVLAATTAQAVLRLEGGSLQTIATVGGLAPDGVSTFTSFGPIAVSAELLAFQATTSSGAGLFAFDGTSLEIVADSATVLPASGLLYEQASPAGTHRKPLAVDGARLYFVQEVQNQCQAGAYVWESGALEQVVGPSTLDPASGQPLLCVYDVFAEGDRLWFRGSPTPPAGGGPGIPFTDGSLYAVTARGAQRLFGQDDPLFGGRVYQFDAVLDSSADVVFVSTSILGDNAGLFAVSGVGSAPPVPGPGPFGLVVLVALLGGFALRRLAVT